MLHQIVAAPGALSDEGRRRLARVEKLFGAKPKPQPKPRGRPCLTRRPERAPCSHEKYERLIAAAQKQPTIKVAVAHPCDDVSLRGAVEADGCG